MLSVLTVMAADAGDLDTNISMRKYEPKLSCEQPRVCETRGVDMFTHTGDVPSRM